MERPLSGLWQADSVEEAAEDRDAAVGPEGSMEADSLTQIHKGFHAEKGEGVADSRGEGSAGSSVAEGEELPHHQPGYRLDTHIAGAFKHKDQHEGQPVQAARRLDITEVDEETEAGEHDGHDEAGDDEKRPAAQLVRQHAGGHGGQQLDGGRDDGHQVGVEAGKHLAEDGDGVEVEGGRAGKPVEEHEAGGEKDGFEELGHEDGLAVGALLAHAPYVRLQHGQVHRNVGGRDVIAPAFEPLQRLFRLGDSASVDEIAGRLGRVLDGDEKHEGRACANEGQLAPVQPGAHQEAGHQAEMAEYFEAGREAAAQFGPGDFADVDLAHKVHHC